ncbi:hypothetical protein [Psychroserpens sp.]|uniref:hypothetical protein n=1 Tax=Psychroserpens sp. TaxID=2020870 RepID=UPI001B2BA640|nr:hypothetical protein [Psychroserpens sp.]MBO6606654.1 hypothetical protein [Psychroserpens sp.]MBO6631892.1 hypothetical protein [Psychroserpens sp.]MBO6653358.1 hypothetical protein [Psychroserpens sp.]MBO6680615.1 hypothetical protein [Psychroserpens sp.]MBO6750427.1 hypothetical protein [Psychroserpens sp.]
MKKKNIKDSILKILNSKEIPLIPHAELLSQLKFDREEIGLAIIELEKKKQIAIFKPQTKDDTLKISLTQDGTIFINNTSYYKEFKKQQTNNYYKTADKAIAILGILTGIIFGINSCSSENKNDQLIEIIKQKDSIINDRNTNLNKFNIKLDSVNFEIKELKLRLDSLNIKNSSNPKKTK